MVLVCSTAPVTRFNRSAALYTLSSGSQVGNEQAATQAPEKLGTAGVAVYPCHGKVQSHESLLNTWLFGAACG